MTLRGWLACWCLLTGCASIFTGTRQTVTVDTAPPGSMAMALGGAAGTVLGYAHGADQIRAKVLELIDPYLTAPQREQLRVVDLPELLGLLGAAIHTQEQTPEVVQLRNSLATVPQPIRENAFGLLGLAGIGDAPLTLELKKGKSYAVIGWREGYKGAIAIIDTHFNWVTLLNIFNLGLGIPIDILTGAWMNLTPDKVQLSMPRKEGYRARAAHFDSTESVAGSDG